MPLLILIISTLFACGAKQKTRSDDVKMHTPPEDDSFTLPNGPPVLVAEPIEKQVVAVSDVKAEGPLLAKAELDAFIKQGPPYALSQVTVEPEKKGNTMVGYKIIDMTTNARTRLDPHLVAGDVITHINGIKLKTPDDYFEAWKSLNGAKAIRVDYVRGGVATNLVWVVQ